jgi:hypothetical protein
VLEETGESHKDLSLQGLESYRFGASFCPEDTALFCLKRLLKVALLGIGWVS